MQKNAYKRSIYVNWLLFDTKKADARHIYIV